MSARELGRRRDEVPRQDSMVEQCSFCREKPSGRTSHAGLALRVNDISPTIRTHVCLKCSFCGTRWARRRVRAKAFEWCRLAD